MGRLNPAEQFYSQVLATLSEGKASFLVAGRYSTMHYSGIKVPTKDLDLLCRPRDVNKIISLLKKAGISIEMTYRSWLFKAYNKKYYVDFIFRSSNGKNEVTDEWFENADQGILLTHKVKFASIEDIILAKMYVVGRDCFHGHDIYKLIRDFGLKIKWERIWNRMKDDWQVLAAHIFLFDYVFPNLRNNIPTRIRKRVNSSKPRAINEFRGNVLSLVDYKSIKELKKLHNHPLKESKFSKS